MSKFKVGDRVKRIQGGDNEGFKVGDVGIVENIALDFCDVYLPNGCVSHGNSEKNLELDSNNNNTNMNIKEQFKLAFMKEPEKSFRKAGITNGDDFLTDDGQKVFLGWLLQKHGVDFKKEVVDDLLKEQAE